MRLWPELTGVFGIQLRAVAATAVYFELNIQQGAEFRLTPVLAGHCVWRFREFVGNLLAARLGSIFHTASRYC